MSAFDLFAAKVGETLADVADMEVRIERPVSKDGFSFLTISARDGYLVEVEWRVNYGFGVTAGRDLIFGSGVDELYATVESAQERVLELARSRQSTSSDQPVDLAVLRNLQKILQKDLAHTVGISKSALAQMEGAASVSSMRVETLQKVLAGMGAELVLTARFPNGSVRYIRAE